MAVPGVFAFCGYSYGTALGTSSSSLFGYGSSGSSSSGGGSSAPAPSNGIEGVDFSVAGVEDNDYVFDAGDFELTNEESVTEIAGRLPPAER